MIYKTLTIPFILISLSCSGTKTPETNPIEEKINTDTTQKATDPNPSEDKKNLSPLEKWANIDLLDRCWELDPVLHMDESQCSEVVLGDRTVASLAFECWKLRYKVTLMNGDWFQRECFEDWVVFGKETISVRALEESTRSCLLKEHHIRKGFVNRGATTIEATDGEVFDLIDSVELTPKRIEVYEMTGKVGIDFFKQYEKFETLGAVVPPCFDGPENLFFKAVGWGP